MISRLNSGVLQDPQKILEDVLVYSIGKKLSLSDFAALARVCKIWQTMIQPHIEKKLLEEVKFGKDKWLSIPGVFSVSEEIAFTEDQKKELIAKLKGKCKFFNEPDPIQPHRFQNNKIKRAWQTHKLIFFTEEINEKPRTINSQNKIFHFIKEVDDETAFYYIIGKEEDAFRNQPAPKSYWGLVTLDVIPGSRKTNHGTKESLLKSKEYKVLTPNDATTSNLVMNLGPSKEKKDYFFGKKGDYWTYTVTTELYDSYRLVVGATSPSGPVVYYFKDESSGVGTAGVVEVP